MKEGSRRTVRPELEKKRESERLGGAASTPGHASQGGGGDEGEFNSVEEEASVVNFARKLVGVFFH